MEAKCPRFQLQQVRFAGEMRAQSLQTSQAMQSQLNAYQSAQAKNQEGRR